jgi:N-acetyl-gamma-glutamyl-phosphate reductase
MPTKIFIDGAEGTTGLRLADRLCGRDDIEVLTIDSTLRKDAGERARLSNLADIVFLCLPDAAAKEAVVQITNPATRIIDASTAHRVSDLWAYGLPELSCNHREAIANAAWVANPGCHASGFISLVYPIVSEGIAPKDYPFTCHSVTGYSGGGRSLIESYQDPHRAACYHTPRQYALGQKHKHLPEMRVITGIDAPPVFNPILGDFYAGMVVTVPLHVRLLSSRMGAKKLHAFMEDYYRGQKLVRVMPFGAEEAFEGGMIDAGALEGKDYMEIFVCGHEGQIVLISRFDNLGKGASGAAIQCMNIMMGVDETTGLVV